jgi:polyvinyl alcohol dehydrogenase (cytochrome)
VSGAAVWSGPTIDVQRQALYVATGDNYSDPPSDTSDAIVAFEFATGRMLWEQSAARALRAAKLRCQQLLQ